MSDTSETVTLSRAEYEALIERVEDAEDLATVAAAEARETALGKDEARAEDLPLELVRGSATARTRSGFGAPNAASSGKPRRRCGGRGELPERERNGAQARQPRRRKIAADLRITLDDLAA